MIPFTVDQFLRVFARYNVTVWPAQLVLFALGILAIWLAFQRRVELAKGISFILALFWLWMGLVYHFWFFSVINPAALIFAAFFVLQGMLFFLVGVVKHQLRFRFKTDFYGIVGSVFLIYALIVYPVVGYWVGLRYPTAPTFGVPCPTTIFTFGMLLAAASKIPIYVLLIPFLWSLVGFWAALSLGMTGDYGLVVAGLITLLLSLVRGRRKGVAVV